MKGLDIEGVGRSGKGVSINELFYASERGIDKSFGEGRQ